jgi:hypothetical protein
MLAAVGAVDFGSLLGEMTDRDRLARLPDPPFVTAQASSYDRAHVAPDQPGWFSNHDFEQFLRIETIAGRQEWVVMDAAGPGVLTRFWKGGADPAKIVRFYLDGAAEPVIAEPAEAFLGGHGWVAPPFAATRGRGFNLYLPIPYAKHCKVTFDRLPDWYNIEYRTYPAGTEVTTFSRAQYEAAGETLARAAQTLAAPGNPTGEVKVLAPRAARLAPGAALGLDLAGPAAVRRLSVQVAAEDLTQALRSTVLVGSFDGEETLWAPLGDFFGSGVGLHPYRTWTNEVQNAGLLTCFWTMPFQQSGRFELRNLGDQSVDVVLGRAELGPWAWDDRSLHFHANWRQQYPIHTKKADGTMDWNYITIDGQGQYVGDTLAIHNGSSGWWGEGDEKIWVDGDRFPSHLGTGTEDFYGYSWGDPSFFEGPWHAQPQWTGNNHVGHTTDTRVRLLDGIPFQKRLQLDLEIWHWDATDVAYAATSYWYARPGARCNRGPEPAEAARRVPPGTRILVLEGEAMPILACSGGHTEIQHEARWSGGQQLWWRDAAVGDKLELGFKLAAGGRYHLVMANTRAFDYGIARITLDGKALGEPVDFYSAANVLTDLDLGQVELTAGQHRLGFEIVGANAKAAPRHMVGLDCLRLEGVK